MERYSLSKSYKDRSDNTRDYNDKQKRTIEEEDDEDIDVLNLKNVSVKKVQELLEEEE